MPLYRLTRERVQDLMIELVADSPEQAVKRAYTAKVGDWAEIGVGLALIDSVSEADKGSAGRCWRVECGLDLAVTTLHEVDG